MAELVNSNILEQFFTVSAETITAWTRKGMPKESGGKFDFIKAVKWRITQLEKELHKDKFLTRKEVATLLGYKNEKYVNELEREYGLPKEEWNKYDIKKVVEWFIGYTDSMHRKEIQKLKSENPQDDLTRTNQKLRELQYQVRMGDLVEKAEVEYKWVNEVKTFNKALRVVPNKIMPKLKPLFKTPEDAITALKIIAEEINEPCNRLSETSIIKRKKDNAEHSN